MASAIPAIASAVIPQIASGLGKLFAGKSDEEKRSDIKSRFGQLDSTIDRAFEANYSIQGRRMRLLDEAEKIIKKGISEEEARELEDFVRDKLDLPKTLPLKDIVAMRKDKRKAEEEGRNAERALKSYEFYDGKQGRKITPGNARLVF